MGEGRGGGERGVTGFFNFQGKTPGNEVDDLYVPFRHRLQTTHSNLVIEASVTHVLSNQF